MAGRWFYDRLYKAGAPWEGGPRDELVAAVSSELLPTGRALDVGCGSGANALFLAENGFDVTGVDFSGRCRGPVTLDDFRPRDRRTLANRMTSWTRAGGRLFLWCFYRDVSWWRRRGARFPGGLAPGEEAVLFGAAFEIERLPAPPAGSGFACFLLTRR